MFPCLRRLSKSCNAEPFHREATTEGAKEKKSHTCLQSDWTDKVDSILPSTSQQQTRPTDMYAVHGLMALQTKPRQPDWQRNPETLAGPSLRSHSIQEPIVLQFFVSQHAKRNGFSRLSQSKLRGDQTLRPRGSELPLNRQPSTLRPSLVRPRSIANPPHDGAGG